MPVKMMMMMIENSFSHLLITFSLAKGLNLNLEHLLVMGGMILDT